MKSILELKGISKSFPGVNALSDINLDLKPGEVHVLLGENGAGKSTLMKIISGAYHCDAGEIFFNGQLLEKNSPIISEQLGLRMIYQELNLVPELTVSQNIFLGHPIKKLGINNYAEMKRETVKILSDLKLPVLPTTLIKELGVGTQQMIEIAKALSKNAKVFVFDEPTSSLADREIKELFRIIRMLKEQGVGMFYISHRLEEVFEIGDRVTIMRDGQIISTSDVADMDMEKIIEGIAGRKIKNLFPHTRKEAGKVRFEVQNLTGAKFKDVSLTVSAGEIVGMAGLVGAGRTEFARAVFGVDKTLSGVVLLDGEILKRNSAKESVKRGLCLLPENRKTEGLALEKSISENICIAALNETFLMHMGGFGIIDRKKEKRLTNEYVESLRISTPSIKKLTRFLSGGTQQKVVLAKWLLSHSNVFIFDEPTRGIDVGTKSEIYRLMDELVERGAAILMISSDLTEILGMSDRVYVMCQGTLAGQLDREEATQNRILQMAFGQAGKEQTYVG